MRIQSPKLPPKMITLRDGDEYEETMKWDEVELQIRDGVNHQDFLDEHSFCEEFNSDNLIQMDLAVPVAYDSTLNTKTKSMCGLSGEDFAKYQLYGQEAFDHQNQKAPKIKRGLDAQDAEDYPVEWADENISKLTYIDPVQIELIKEESKRTVTQKDGTQMEKKTITHLTAKGIPLPPQACASRMIDDFRKSMQGKKWNTRAEFEE